MRQRLQIFRRQYYYVDQGKLTETIELHKESHAGLKMNVKNTSVMLYNQLMNLPFSQERNFYNFCMQPMLIPGSKDLETNKKRIKMTGEKIAAWRDRKRVLRIRERSKVECIPITIKKVE